MGAKNDFVLRLVKFTATKLKGSTLFSIRHVTGALNEYSVHTRVFSPHVEPKKETQNKQIESHIFANRIKT